MYILHDHNDHNLIQMEWVDSNEISADLGMKNLDSASHKKDTKTLCGNQNKLQLISK